MHTNDRGPETERQTGQCTHSPRVLAFNPVAAVDVAYSDQRSTHLDIPFDHRMNTTVMVHAPSGATIAVLVLLSSQNGNVIFRDEGDVFQLQ